MATESAVKTGEATDYPRPSIAAVVFSRNEADLLSACLSRLVGFDELIVCDMKSTDLTQEISKSFGARVIEVEDVPIAERVRQVALDEAGTDWVLFVDADEHLPEGFVMTLRQYLLSRPELVGVRLRYANLAFGRPLHEYLNGSAKYSLVRRDRTLYPPDVPPHSMPTFDGPVGDAPDSVPSILHLSFRDVSQTLEKMLRYARHAPGKQESLSSPAAVLRMVARTVILDGAWKDGTAGLTVGTLSVIGQLYGATVDWENGGYKELKMSTGVATALRVLGFVHPRAVALRSRIQRLRA